MLGRAMQRHRGNNRARSECIGCWCETHMCPADVDCEVSAFGGHLGDGVPVGFRGQGSGLL